MNRVSSLLSQTETLFEFAEGNPRLFQRDPELGLIERVGTATATADNRVFEFQFADALLEYVPAVWAGERERTVVLKHDGYPANDAAYGSCTALSPILRAAQSTS